MGYRAQQRALRKTSNPQSSAAVNRLHWAAQSQPSMAYKLEAAWVLIFNVGQRDEGVYTQTQHNQGTSVLAFECTDDAHRFAQFLLSKDYYLATPIYWSAGRLTTFCRTAGFDVSMLTRGTVPMPPSKRHHDTSDQLGGEREGG